MSVLDIDTVITKGEIEGAIVENSERECEETQEKDGESVK